MSDFLPHPFWNFSLELYAGEGVAEACLDLQDRRGCDVNVLLFCCWLGASGRPTLTAERLRAILKVSDVWQSEIVRPLRQVRRLLKDKPWLEALPETVDAGTACDTPRDLSDLSLGYGVGARVRTPIGPFRVDVAYGQDNATVRLHFSVGLAF